jgi:ATP-binding cassette subfamily B protein
MSSSRIEYTRRAFGYLRPYWKLAGFAALLLILGAVFSLLTPWPLKILIDHVLESHPLPPLLDWMVGSLGDSRTALLLFAVIGGLVVTLVQSGLGVVSKYVNTAIEQNMMLDVRSDLYQHTQRLSLAYHDQKKTGRVIYAINNQGGAAAGLVMALQPVVQNVLTLGGMFWIVTRIDMQLGLLSLVVVPFLYWSVGYYAQRIVPEVRRVRDMEMNAISLVHEAITMLRVVLAFGREDHEYRRFRRQGEEALDARVKVTIGETLFSSAVNLSTALGTALVLGFGAFRALNGHLSAGELLVVMTYIASVYKPLEGIIYTIGSLHQKFVGLETVFGLLDKEPDIQDRPGATAYEGPQGAVAFENVSFKYTGRRRTLENISFAVKPGAFVGIVGPTGAGKSTLLSLIPRFYNPQKGRVLVDGRDVRDVTVKSLRSAVSIVLQEPVLFSGTVADNIRYGRLDADMAAIEAAARGANAHDFIERLPGGYESVLGERGAQLSVGERQRICIARAFLKDAPILLQDEPTSAVDSRTEAVILEALGRLASGRTTFLIAHRLSTVRNADLILVIDDGRLVEQGTHDDLVALDGLYRQLYEAQVGRRSAAEETAILAPRAAGVVGGAS